MSSESCCCTGPEVDNIRLTTFALIWFRSFSGISSPSHDARTKFFKATAALWRVLIWMVDSEMSCINASEYPLLFSAAFNCASAVVGGVSDCVNHTRRNLLWLTILSHVIIWTQRTVEQTTQLVDCLLHGFWVIFETVGGTKCFLKVHSDLLKLIIEFNIWRFSRYEWKMKKWIVSDLLYDFQKTYLCKLTDVHVASL